MGTDRVWPPPHSLPAPSAPARKPWIPYSRLFRFYSVDRGPLDRGGRTPLPARFCDAVLLAAALPAAQCAAAGKLTPESSSAAAAVLQTLYAYPIAGSQTYFLRVLLILAAAITLLDGLHSLHRPAGLAAMVRSFARPASALTLAAVALAYPVSAYRASRRYASLTPLNMPGAERIHLDRDGSQGLPVAGAPLATELRHLCGPAGNTEPLFLDRQAVAGSGAPASRPAEFGFLDVDVIVPPSSRRSSMICRGIPEPARSTTRAASISGTPANSMSGIGRWRITS